MGYRRRSSPLHAVRAAVGGGLCVALALVALLYDHPLVLAAALTAGLAAGAAAGVGRELRRTLLFALPFTLLIAFVNPFVSREGLTVIARLGELPWFGRVDLTLEATVYGGVLALRALGLIVAFALLTLVVDPDELLRLFRRVSFRSALTATLATRMIPVLQRDGQRIADAQRCRPGDPPSRLTLVRAVASGALDRAVEVAAALEVRGYGSGGASGSGAARGSGGLSGAGAAGAGGAGASGAATAGAGAGAAGAGAAVAGTRAGAAGSRRFARHRRPWSRHDLAFAAAAVALAALAVGGRLAGAAAFETYPRLAGDWGGATWALAAAVVLLPLLPALDRRGLA